MILDSIKTKNCLIIKLRTRVSESSSFYNIDTNKNDACTIGYYILVEYYSEQFDDNEFVLYVYS